jgi:hypothetical protein
MVPDKADQDSRRELRRGRRERHQQNRKNDRNHRHDRRHDAAQNELDDARVLLRWKQNRRNPADSTDRFLERRQHRASGTQQPAPAEMPAGKFPIRRLWIRAGGNLDFLWAHARPCQKDIGLEHEMVGLIQSIADARLPRVQCEAHLHGTGLGRADAGWTPNSLRRSHRSA